MSDTLSNILPNRGRRRHIQVDVDDEGVEAAPLNDNRSVIVWYNDGPNTAWMNKTIETATPEEGFPLKSGGAIVDDASIDAWCFKTDTGELADVRGWEVNQP